MVNGKLIAIGALVVCAVAVGAAVIYTSLPYGVEYPESEILHTAPETQTLTPEFRVDISYHDDKIYGDTEFKVQVFDKETKKPVSQARVTFMIPQIHMPTNRTGVVYFTAPLIQELYLIHPNDTMRAFPITVQKATYKSWSGLIKVHIRE